MQPCWPDSQADSSWIIGLSMSNSGGILGPRAFERHSSKSMEPDNWDPDVLIYFLRFQRAYSQSRRKKIYIIKGIVQFSNSSK